MRRSNGVASPVLVAVLLVVLLAGALSQAALPYASAQDTADPRGSVDEPAHLVVVIADGGEARVNRMDWDVNAFAPLSVGAAVRGSDYIDVSGRTTLQILCANLILIEQRGSEVPRCDPYASDPAFYYTGDPAWSMVGSSPVIVTYPANLASVPANVNPGGYITQELSGGELDAVVARVDAILALNLPAAPATYALASFYRGQGMIFEALAAFEVVAEGQCVTRPSVNAASVSDPLAASPETYLRIGELYDILGLTDDALRNYRCAADLASSVNDQASAALAFARQATIELDPVRAIELYQYAINNYVALGAVENATLMLEVCGSRNCTME